MARDGQCREEATRSEHYIRAPLFHIANRAENCEMGLWDNRTYWQTNPTGVPMPDEELLREKHKRFITHPEEATFADIRDLAISVVGAREACALQAEIQGGVAVAVILWHDGQQAKLSVTSPAMDDERLMRHVAGILRFYTSLGKVDGTADDTDAVDIQGTFKVGPVTPRTEEDARHRPIVGDQRIDPIDDTAWTVTRVCDWAVESSDNGRGRLVEGRDDWAEGCGPERLSTWKPKVGDIETCEITITSCEPEKREPEKREPEKLIQLVYDDEPSILDYPYARVMPTDYLDLPAYAHAMPMTGRVSSAKSNIVERTPERQLPDVGTPVDIGKLPTMAWQRDLLYADGPLVSHFTSESGDQYLWVWTDLGSSRNRWLVVRVSDVTVKALKERALSLKVALATALDTTVFVVDWGGLGKGEVVAVSVCPIDQLPDSYRSKSDKPLPMSDGD